MADAARRLARRVLGRGSVLVALGVLAACASSPAPAPDPALQWAERVLARIEVAQVRESHPLRYNPAPCDCPPYEVELEGVWHRVAFIGVGPDDPVFAAVDEARRAAPQGVWQVQGRLASTLTTCARGAIVVTLAPSAFGPPPLEEDR